jgi:hypothetical protein
MKKFLRSTAIVGLALAAVMAAGSLQFEIRHSARAPIAPQTSVLTIPQQKQTYSAVVTGLTPAASATDFWTIAGSATKTVRVQHASCWGVATAATAQLVRGVLRSTANTGGTSAAPTIVEHDQNNNTPTATVLSYTANPTQGTLLGVALAGYMTFGTLAAPAANITPFGWGIGESGSRAAPQQEIVLRGTSQVFALNGNGASFPAGTAMTCRITWVEE